MSCRCVIQYVFFVILIAINFNNGVGAKINPDQKTSNSKWWKGNLHTHSFWSDGDDFPEMIVSWYVENGYNFLALSDHNILQEGDKWIFPAAGGEAVEKTYLNYLAKFGKEWIETEEDPELGLTVRLKPLNEFRSLFETPGQFLLIQGEEITARFINKPVHLNASNLATLITPKSGRSVREVIQNNVNAVMEQRRQIGRPILVHVNHPNFDWALTAEDIAEIENEKFFEVYNGHPSVRNYGDAAHISTEEMWDQILIKRLTNGSGEIIYGIATDDAHNYHQYQTNRSNPGRGWVMVKAAFLTPELIIRAMEKGDFYSSTGVIIKSFEKNWQSFKIEIEPEDGITYITQFIGKMKSNTIDSESMDSQRRNSKERVNGQILAEESGFKVQYDFKGDEIYVRAKVISSKEKENPYHEGEFESAWLQPTVEF